MISTPRCLKIEAGTTADSVSELLLRVARRADVLAPRCGAPSERSRRAWLRAELEVFEQFERAQPAALEAE